jgi:hypothetical protein
VKGRNTIEDVGFTWMVSPMSSSEDWNPETWVGEEWKPNDSHEEDLSLDTNPTLKLSRIKSSRIRTKDTPITQEIPEDLGALFQEPGRRPDVFYYVTVTRWRLVSNAL